MTRYRRSKCDECGGIKRSRLPGTTCFACGERGGAA